MKELLPALQSLSFGEDASPKTQGSRSTGMPGVGRAPAVKEASIDEVPRAHIRTRLIPMLVRRCWYYLASNHAIVISRRSLCESVN